MLWLWVCQTSSWQSFLQFPSVFWWCRKLYSLTPWLLCNFSKGKTYTFKGYETTREPVGFPLCQRLMKKIISRKKKIAPTNYTTEVVCIDQILTKRTTWLNRELFLAASRVANAGSPRAPSSSSSSSSSSKTFRTRLFYIQDPDLLKY